MQTPKQTVKIAPDVHWVGIKDWDRRMFDRLIPLPKGTSYNAYLLQGKEKTALIDTVNPGFEGDLEAKIRKIINPKDIEYIIMNHAEPDHANAISYILSLTENATVLSTTKGKEMAQSLYHLSDEKIKTVQDGETLELGDKTLRFIETPWTHWPETMMTFYEEEGILFPSDFFGAHMATSKFYDEELGDILHQYAKSYFGEIMMPYRKMAKRALEKVRSLDLAMIAPSHGPMYKHPEEILNAYREWTTGKVQQKVLIPYISMWGNTEKIAKVVIETIASEGVEVVPFNLATINLGGLARELVDSAGVIIGTPTVLGGAHPTVYHIAYLATKLNPPTRYVGIFESHGWHGGAVRQISGMVEKLDAEVVGTVEIRGSPREEEIDEIVNFGKKFARKIKTLR